MHCRAQTRKYVLRSFDQTVRLTVVGRELPVTLDEAELEIDGGSD